MFEITIYVQLLHTYLDIAFHTNKKNKYIQYIIIIYINVKKVYFLKQSDRLQELMATSTMKHEFISRSNTDSHNWWLR